MVAFVPLDITDEDSIGLVMQHADHVTQYHEGLEPRYVNSRLLPERFVVAQYPDGLRPHIGSSMHNVTSFHENRSVAYEWINHVRACYACGLDVNAKICITIEYDVLVQGPER